jgi:hypothetical protein
VNLSGPLMHMHGAKVHQLISIAIVDQLPFNLRQSPLTLSEHSFLISPAHGADTTSRRAQACEAATDLPIRACRSVWRGFSNANVQRSTDRSSPLGELVDPVSVEE